MSKRIILFYFFNENEGGIDPIYNDDELEDWMCPCDCEIDEFYKHETEIKIALSIAYDKKKDALELTEIYAIILRTVLNI